MWQQVLSVRNRSWAWFKARAESPHAFWWLMLLAFLEPLLSPIVPETLLVAMLLAGANRWKFYAFWMSVFSVLGGIVGYFLGAILFKSIGTLIIDFYALGPYVEKAQTLFSENVFTTMTIVTATPVPDKVFVFFAGFLGVSFWFYLLGYIFGRSARIFFVSWILQKFGPRMLAIADRYFAWVSTLFLILLALLILDAFGVVHLSLLLPWK